MKLLPEILIMNRQKITCLKVENVTWLDSLNYLAMPLRKLPEAFCLTVQKSSYPHLFNTTANMNYVGPAPGVSYYDIDHMHESERKEFLAWYETVVKKEVFDNRRVLESYCQADLTVLREACRTFRKHFLQIGNVEVFLEGMTIASACNKLFLNKFLQPDRISIIPVRSHTDNRKQSRKAIAWLLLEERRTGKKILHGRNGKERQLPELPNVYVWMASARRRAPFTSSTGVTGTDIRASHSETYLSRVGVGPCCEFQQSGPYSLFIKSLIIKVQNQTQYNKSLDKGKGGISLSICDV